MQGVFSTAQHRRRLAPVEKRIAGGTVAHPAALMLGQPGYFGGNASRPGRQDHRIRRVVSFGGLHHQRAGIIQPHHLRRDELRPDRFGAGHTLAVQLHPGDALLKAIVVLDQLRFA